MKKETMTQSEMATMLEYRNFLWHNAESLLAKIREGFTVQKLRSWRVAYSQYNCVNTVYWNYYKIMYGNNLGTYKTQLTGNYAVNREDF